MQFDTQTGFVPGWKHIISVTFFTTILLVKSLALNAQEFYHEVPFEVENDKIYVQVLINDRPYRFLFDTGATGYGRIDSALVVKLGLQIVGQTSNFDGMNSANINLVNVPKIEFAGIVLENMNMSSRNYNRGSAKLLHGVIGNRFWEDYLLEIRYSDKKLVLSDSSLSKNDANTISYTRPFLVPIEIGDDRTQGFIDTGSFLGLLLPIEYVDQKGFSDTTELGRARSANTRLHLWQASFSGEVKLAGNIESPVHVAFSDVFPGINIGIRYLKDYDVAFDQRKRLVRIRKPK